MPQVPTENVPTLTPGKGKIILEEETEQIPELAHNLQNLGITQAFAQNSAPISGGFQVVSSSNSPPVQNTPSQSIGTSGLREILIEGEEIVNGRVVEKKQRVHMINNSGGRDIGTGALAHMFVKKYSPIFR